MPCFKGLAVSIHTPDGPISEHSIQKQGRVGRITSYIPVPPAKIAAGTTQPEPSTFAVSITLLTPGLSVPYSTPKPTTDDPYPKPQIVGGLPTLGRDRGSYTSAIEPYKSITSSPNETVAAYIYFDGRQKEEVATLLRRGEETWVNSRWVGVPEAEGGGLAEREFLFREVGLERWLNGLDLQGKDVQATIEKRRQKIEKRRRRKRAATPTSDSDDETGTQQWLRRRRSTQKGSVLRYGADAAAPLENLSGEDDLSSSEEDTDDDPIPEANGQIKVALFRVIASGEVKKGEYSPQFDAHDDDDDAAAREQNGEGGEANVDHTTSFAKPKTLDPQSISTQTVTGIDGPDKPYAVFTFLYRGEKQLQKMGILKSKKPAVAEPSTSNTKRRSVGVDFGNLKPLKPGGALAFTGIRDNVSPSDKNGKVKDFDEMDSDDDDDRGDKDDAEDDFKTGLLSPEDAKKEGTLAEGVKKIKLKRQHSFEPSPSPVPKGETSVKTERTTESPPLLPSTAFDPSTEKLIEDSEIIGSPLKKQRASMSGVDTELRRSTAEEVARGLGFGFGGSGGEMAPGSAGGGFGGELKKPTFEAGGTGGIGGGTAGGEAKPAAVADSNPIVKVAADTDDEEL